MVDFLASLFTSRLMKALGDTGLLKEMSWGEIMRLLKDVKKVKVGEGEWMLARMTPTQIDMISRLGLFEERAKEAGKSPKKKTAEEGAPKRLGRPPGSKKKPKD